MKIYNTLTKKKEDFIPIDENQVSMYTCGPTVYHYAHIGNLRSYIMEDVLEKTLKYIPDLSISFLYAHPEKLDYIKQTLVPVLGEKRLIIASEENVEAATRKFSQAIGR